ncbi:MAG: hypothetical protein RL456_555 [Pseudomonadota bacterium]|jgi:hypothetical protein
MKTPSILNPLRALVLGTCVAATALAPMAARAHGESEASVASALSLGVPIAVSMTAPSAVMSAGAALTVVSVQVVAGSTIWVLERASDAARISVRLSAEGAQAVSVGVGTAVAVTVLGAGWILSAAGKALCFVPNAIGASLTHHERITP